MFERKPSVPGDAKRLELAELALSTLKHLITGYKQIYLSLYESANVLYGPQRSNANKIALRKIDLLVLEQLLATAVQAPLPSNSIKTFNKMFCALSAYEPQLITLPQPSLSLGDRSSIKALYLRYQAILVLDLMRISASLHKAVKPYIDRYIGLLTVLPFDRSIAPSADAWVISHDSNTVPGFLALGEKINHGRFPSVVIEVGRFFNAIKKDYAECIELLTGSNKKHSSKVLGAIKLPYAATIISELNHSILFNENNQHIPSFSSYQPFPCKVYSGFDDCIAYFNYQYALKTKKPERKGESVKDLPPKPTAAKGEWLCAMRDENSLYLQVNEGKISLPIDIGHVLLFAVENANDESEQTQTLLTQVIRMERGQHGKLSVIVKLIGSQITHVSTATAAKDPAANHSSALLAINGEQRIFIADHQYPIGASVAIALPDSSPAMIALEGFTVITQKIQCLLLR